MKPKYKRRLNYLIQNYYFIDNNFNNSGDVTASIIAANIFQSMNKYAVRVHKKEFENYISTQVKQKVVGIDG